LRQRLDIPGIAVMQFGFNDEGAHMYLPHNAAGKVLYTGTHDNDTTVGWFHSGASAQERSNAEAYLGRCDDGIHWAFIRAAQNSVAELALIPLQDVLGLGSEARMNTPSMPGGNWKWRFSPGQFSPQLTAKLAQLAAVTDRLPPQVPVLPNEDFAA
jgi:4-alpha-glucanotransferase